MTHLAPFYLRGITFCVSFILVVSSWQVALLLLQQLFCSSHGAQLPGRETEGHSRIYCNSPGSGANPKGLGEQDFSSAIKPAADPLVKKRRKRRICFFLNRNECM